MLFLSSRKASACSATTSLSRVVRDHIRDRIQLTFDDYGEQSVKNIERPVRVFGVRLDPRSAPSIIKKAQILAPASRLSIVVLPFDNLSNDPEQEYFADGIVEDLTTDLSRITGSFVIARNTAFTYKGKPVDAKDLGRQLGVNYMLEGSVRRLGNQVRINVQLIDTQTGGHIWANRFDGDVGDLFALQDSITSNLAMTLSLELVEAAAQRASQKMSPDEVDLVLRGRAAALRLRSRESVGEAKQFYEQALSVAPNSAEAKIGLAEVLAGSALSLLSVDREGDLMRADQLVSIGLTQHPNSAWAHYVNGEILRCRRRANEAAAEYQTAIALDRNYVPAIANLAFVKILSGVPAQAIPLLEVAIRRSPRDPLLAIWHSRIGQAEMYRGRFEEAKEALERSRSLNPNLAWSHFYLAGIYALLGTTEKAKAALIEAQRLSPDLTSVVRYKSISQIGNLNLQALRERTLIRGLRLAGLPDQEE
jgi:adenylate cyclase